MLLDRKIGGFSPQKPKKIENYVQEEFYCEMCGRTTKEETELHEATTKYLCSGCLEEQERKTK
tara:strand:+ start:7 stop:195 length:189 start_codon:yes stop_codon:yes gene_type:complete